jgi:hypothetical protein
LGRLCPDIYYPGGGVHALPYRPFFSMTKMYVWTQQTSTCGGESAYLC